MKSHYILFIILFFSFSRILAQGNYQGNGIGRIGIDNRLYRNQPIDDKDENERASKLVFEKMMIKLKNDLKLDDLQYFAIQKTLNDSNKEQNIVLNKENSQDEKVSEIIAINKKTDAEINSYLNKEQKEKYKIFNEDKNKRIEKLKEDFQK